MKIGCHVPMHYSARNAEAANADVVQIHLGSPQKWGQTALPKGMVAENVFIHGPYLINYSSAKESVIQNCLFTMLRQGQTAKEIGALGIVVHGGSWKKHDRESALEQWADGIRQYPLELPTLLIENSANGQHSFTRELDELAALWDYIGAGNVGFCLDTAHLWANLHNADFTEETYHYIHKLKSIVGSINLVHANGSAADRGSGVDRHSPLASSIAPDWWVAECVRLSGCQWVVAETTQPVEDVQRLKEML